MGPLGGVTPVEKTEVAVHALRRETAAERNAFHTGKPSRRRTSQVHQVQRSKNSSEHIMNPHAPTQHSMVWCRREEMNAGTLVI